MFNRKIILLTTGIVLCLAFHPQEALAERFKGSDFLEWPENNQENFMNASVLMAGAIASQNSDSQGRCIYDWYFSGDINEARSKIVETMKQHPDFSPSGVVIAVLQKPCGSLKY